MYCQVRCFSTVCLCEQLLVQEVRSTVAYCISIRRSHPRKPGWQRITASYLARARASSFVSRSQSMGQCDNDQRLAILLNNPVPKIWYRPFWQIRDETLPQWLRRPRRARLRQSR